MEGLDFYPVKEKSTEDIVQLKRASQKKYVEQIEENG